MKHFLLFSVFFLCVNFIEGQKIEVAPIDDAFLDYQKQKKAGQLKAVTSDGHYLGLIPSPVKYHFSEKTGVQLKGLTAPDLPSVYDLRQIEGGAYLTDVKDQGLSNTCWAFATYGAVESYMLKRGNGICDFSEQNLATCHGFDWDESGNQHIATAYFNRHSGPVNDADDPYTLPENAYCAGGIPLQRFIQQARHLPSRGDATFDVNEIKHAIVDNGALYTSMYWDNKYYNTSGHGYYYSGDTYVNHAVVLVGWDDNKIVEGSSLATPTGPGAWIVRNSWGHYWGEAGYFYISYEDSKALSSITYFPSDIPFDNQVKAYYYDEYGMISSTGYTTETAYGLVMFTVSEYEKLDKVGFYVPASNATVDIEIYKDFFDSNLSNYLGGEAAISCDYPGYYTLEIKDDINLQPNESFFVKIKVTTPGYNYPLAIEYVLDDYNSGALIEEGKCWISQEGKLWDPIGKGTNYEKDLCLKTYTTSNITNELAAGFYVEQRQGVAPFKATFHDYSSGSPIHWSWDFNGDGIEDSNDPNPSYTFTESGIYTVALTITDGAGSSSNEKANFIVVTEPVLCNDLSNDYTTNFETDEELTGWLSYDWNSDDITWGVYSGYGLNDSRCLGYRFSVSEAADDYLVTPCFDLKADIDYKLEFSYRVLQTQFPEKLSVHLATVINNEFNVENCIIDLGEVANESFIQSINTFSVPTDGTYHIGFRCYSDADMNALFLDGVSLSSAMSTFTSFPDMPDAIEVFPNPSDGLFYFKINDSALLPASLIVTNIAGNQVIKQEVKDLDVQIDLSHCENGLYIVEFRYSSGALVKKIIKK